MKNEPKKNKTGKIIKENALVLTGTVITAFGMAVFLVPNKIAPGGVSGLATILHYTLNLPVGVVMLVINVLLFLVAFRQMGKKFAFKSLYSTVLLSLLLDIIQIPAPTTDRFLACVYGGVLMGIGIGLVFRGGASTGGTDLVARMIHKKFRTIGENWLLFILDFAVVVMAAIFFDTELALYALAAVYLSSKLIELVSEGLRTPMAFYIISQKPEAISKRIIDEMERGVTALTGVGMYSGEQRNILFCILEGQHQVATLKRIIKEEDRKAFVSMTAVREVMGEGFKELI